MLKIIAPFHFVDSQPKERSLEHWNTKHPEVVRRCIPTAELYVQNVPIRMSNRTWSFDGVSELWFPDMDAIKRGFGDPELQRELHADEDRFAKREELWLIVNETQIW
jgi:hypothetical protein